MVENILTSLGRLHPVIVHLPIGFLVLVAILDVASYKKRYTQLGNATPFVLLLGFIAAVVSCVFGFLLSRTGDYDETILVRHQVWGILLTAVAGGLYLIRAAAIQRNLNVSRSVRTALSLVILVMVVFTGHFGGSLTHGSDYLSFKSTGVNTANQISPNADRIYADIVQPILQRKCSQCHGQAKRKGGLSLESLEAMLKGGKHGPAIVPGDIKHSEMIRRIFLDPSDEDFMPSDGKTPLTAVETEILRWWVGEGSAGESLRLSSLPDTVIIRSLVDQLIEGERSQPKLTGLVSPARVDTAAIERLRNKGLVVRIVNYQRMQLDVTLPPRSGIRVSEISDDLRPLSKHVVWINLSDNGLTADDLDVLAELTHVERVRLEKNPISDGIVEHLRNLEFLESVNLNETEVTCAGVEGLRKNPAIKRIYLWKTLCDKNN